MFNLMEDMIYLKKYDVEKQIGKGSFGVVFKIKDKHNGVYYAAKHVRARRREQKNQIMEEIKILQNLNHPKILGFIGVYEKEGPRNEIILVTEYLSGGELFERIAPHNNLSESVCSVYIKQILEGVQYLHDNSILHLDLKLENIVCVNKDSTEIKIIDFGMAKKIFPGEEIKIMRGTAEYVAPEIVNYECVSTATDMWAVGVVCYILISGLSPFAGDTEAQTLVNISCGDYDFDNPEFDGISVNAKDFIAGLLQKEPKKRLTAGQGLRHDWIMRRQKQSVVNLGKISRNLWKKRWKKIIFGSLFVLIVSIKC